MKNQVEPAVIEATINPKKLPILELKITATMDKDDLMTTYFELINKLELAINQIEMTHGKGDSFTIFLK